MLESSEIEQPRTQQDLRRWIDEVHRRLGSTAAGRRALRLKDSRTIRKFAQEVWPLALMADAYFTDRTDLLFLPSMSDTSYDARILRAPGEVVHFVQITQALDGEQDYLRMLHLEEHHRAPVTGVVLKKASRRDKHVPETWPDFVEHTQARDNVLQRVLEAVKQKALKRYEEKTSLLVEFESSIAVDEDDRQEFNRFARTELLPLIPHFDWLYLVCGNPNPVAFRWQIGCVDPSQCS